MRWTGPRSTGRRRCGAITSVIVKKHIPSIAVVDDEVSVRRAFVRLLRSAGMNARAFASGAEFLASLPTHAPDCVVLDLNMPGLSGFEMQGRLAQAWPRVAVIVVTGHHTTASEAQAQAKHPVAYLQKPVDEQLLFAAIARAVH